MSIQRHDSVKARHLNVGNSIRLATTASQQPETNGNGEIFRASIRDRLSSNTRRCLLLLKSVNHFSAPLPAQIAASARAPEHTRRTDKLSRCRSSVEPHGKTRGGRVLLQARHCCLIQRTPAAIANDRRLLKIVHEVGRWTLVPAVERCDNVAAQIARELR